MQNGSEKFAGAGGFLAGKLDGVKVYFGYALAFDIEGAQTVVQ
jgi:hypothetical protein